MNLDLNGKHALITGATGGIGAEIARVLAVEGVHLTLTGRNAEKLAALAAELETTASVEVRTQCRDLSSGHEVRGLARECPSVDIVVNCAGMVPAGSLFTVDEACWRAGWDTKVFAYLNMCREFYPLLAARGGGVIVNILGTGSFKKDPEYLCGGMGNAALDFLTQTLGSSSHRDNVRVVGVSPGPTRTARFERVSEVVEAGPGAATERPFQRLLEPREVADLVAFLCSSRSAYQSGSIVVLDGGASISKFKR